MIAAKFATEYNIAVRNHVPIFPHWKEYKKHPKIIKGYIDRVGVSVQTWLFPLFISNTNIVYSITFGNVVYCYQPKFHTDVKAAPMKKSMCGYDEESYSPAALQAQKEVFWCFATTSSAQNISCDLNDYEQWDKLVEHWKMSKK